MRRGIDHIYVVGHALLARIVWFVRFSSNVTIYNPDCARKQKGF